MSREVPLGATAESVEVVELRHTLTQHHPRLPPVYSTPDMIRLMETACFHALQPYCEENEITVGTAINVQHRAATGVGSEVRARATLESIDGRFYIMRVTASDGKQQIGSGTVSRAFVRLGAFLEKVNAGRP